MRLLGLKELRDSLLSTARLTTAVAIIKKTGNSGHRVVWRLAYPRYLSEPAMGSMLNSRHTVCQWKSEATLGHTSAVS